jgi:hypothetical protein
MTQPIGLAQTESKTDEHSFTNMNSEKKEKLLNQLKELSEAMALCEKSIRELTIKHFNELMNV